MSVQDQDIKVSYLNAFSHGVLKGKLTLDEASKMLWAKQTDPDTLRGDAFALKAHHYYEKEAQNYLASPWYLSQIQPAGPDRPNIQKQNQRQAMVARAMVQQATSNNTMTGQQPAPPPAPKSTSIRVYNNRPQASPPPVTKSAGSPDLVTPQLFPGRVIWKGPGGSTLTKVEEPPQLPVSIYTGERSQLAAASRGLPSAWLPQHEVNRQVGQGQAQKGATAISPITGQRSELTAMIRRSVGINE